MCQLVVLNFCINRVFAHENSVFAVKKSGRRPGTAYDRDRDQPRSRA